MGSSYYRTGHFAYIPVECTPPAPAYSTCLQYVWYPYPYPVYWGTPEVQPPGPPISPPGVPPPAPPEWRPPQGPQPVGNPSKEGWNPTGFLNLNINIVQLNKNESKGSK